MGLAILAASSIADAAVPIGIIGGGGIVVVQTPASQMTAYQNLLDSQPQNQSSQLHFMPDSYGGNFQPAMVDLSRYSPPSRGDYVSTPPARLGQTPVVIPPANNSWSALEEQARVNALGANEVVGGTPYVRDAAWIAEGDTIDSCQKYVYDSFYDVERWLDAMNGCVNNDTCKVAFSDTWPNLVAPTIARQVLNDREGNPITNRVWQLEAQGILSGDEAATMDSPDIFSDYVDQFAQGIQSAMAGAPPELLGIPKNAFYAGTQNFIVPQLYATLTAAQAAQIQALGTELAGKQQYYYSGTPADGTVGGNFIPGGVTTPGATSSHAAQGFRDEWDFHQTMNNRTAGMTNGEAIEYGKRQTAMTSGLQAMTAIPWCKASQSLLVNTLGMTETSIKCNPVNIPTTAPASDPYQGGDPDPFMSPATQQGQMNSFLGAAYVGTQGVAVLGGGIVAGGGEQAEILRRSTVAPTHVAPNHAASVRGDSTTERSTDMAVVGTGGSVSLPGSGIGSITLLGVSGTSSATNHSPYAVSPVTRAWQILPPILDTTQPDLALQCSPYLNPTWVASLSSDDRWVMANVWGPVCQVTNTLLQEWSRNELGSPSCLTAGNYRCDWSPQMFVSRFVNNYLSLLAPAKEVEYEYCKRWTETTGGPFSNASPVSQNTANLTTLRNFLNAREAAYDKIMKNVPIKAVDNLGTEKIDSAHLGNGAFGGGYSYDLGWNAQITKRDPTTNDPCEWGGGMTASFDANATVMGVTNEVVSALASINAMPNDSSPGSENGTVAAHLRILGNDLFTPISENFTVNGSTNQPVNSDNETQITIVPDVTIPAGPIQVVLTAGIEYGYGATVQFGANTGSGCQAVPTFSATVSLDPEANLGVWGTATATFAGIIGVGLEVDLTLLGIEIPLTATMNMSQGPDPFGDPVTDTFLNLSVGLDMKLHTLDGEVQVFGEVLGFKVFEVPIITWSGPSVTIPLFRTPTVAVPLPYLDDVDPTNMNGPSTG